MLNNKPKCKNWCGGSRHQILGVMFKIRKGVIVAYEPVLVVQWLTSALNTCQRFRVNLHYTVN